MREQVALANAEISAAIHQLRESQCVEESTPSILEQYVLAPPTGSRNGEDVIKNRQVILHISDKPPDELTVFDDDTQGTLYPGATLGVSEAGQVWANAGGIHKALEFVTSHYWQYHGIPQNFYIYYFKPDNGHYHLFIPHYIQVGRGKTKHSMIPHSHGQQWFLKSHYKVLPSGVFRYNTDQHTLELIRTYDS